MASTAAATAAPSEVRLAGNTYRMSPLRDKDFGEFEQWMRSRVMQIAKDNMAGMEADDRKLMLSAALETANKLTMSSKEAVPLMTCFEGAARLLWLSLRKEQPEMKLADVLAMLHDKKTLEEAMDRFDEINEVDDQAAKGKKAVAAAVAATTPSL